MPRALAVAYVVVSERSLSSTCRLLIFFLQEAVAYCVLSSFVFQRKLTVIIQPSQVFTWRSRMMLPYVVLTTMLFWWLLDILFS